MARAMPPMAMDTAARAHASEKSPAEILEKMALGSP